MDSDELTVWRYFKRDRFDQFLQTRLLYFRKARLFQDTLEGSINELTSKFIEHVGNTSSDPTEVGLHNRRLIETFNQIYRDATFVNCWIASNEEHQHMWNSYADNPQDVCIKTNLGTLRNLFERRPHKLDQEKEFELYVCRVKYLDHKRSILPYLNMLEPFIYKDLSFQNESEIRLLFTVLASKLNYANHHGLNVPIDEIFKNKLTIITNPSAQTEDIEKLRLQIGTIASWSVNASKLSGSS